MLDNFFWPTDYARYLFHINCYLEYTRREDRIVDCLARNAHSHSIVDTILSLIIYIFIIKHQLPFIYLGAF